MSVSLSSLLTKAGLPAGASPPAALTLRNPRVEKIAESRREAIVEGAGPVRNCCRGPPLPRGIRMDFPEGQVVMRLLESENPWRTLRAVHLALGATVALGMGAGAVLGFGALAASSIRQVLG